VTGDVSAVYNRLEQLYGATTTSTWELQDNQLSAEALELFLSFVDEIDLSRFRISRPNQLPRLTISGTEVSVRPSVLLQGGAGGAALGAVHVYVSKLFPFDDQAAAYAATVLHEYVEATLTDRKVASSDSYVIDVFARRVHVGPRAYKRRRNDVTAACEGIAQRWAAV
jgi:hypothetical protein